MTAFMEIDLPLDDRREGKVRVSYRLANHRRLIVTTDRLSAFDRVVAGIPFKGQVLNQLAAWWFEHTGDLVANHFISMPDPNASIVREATPLPVEVVVRGYITGVTSTSLWQQYADGARTIYGHEFPDGLLKNTKLPEPIVTPTTKAEAGAHDVPITCDEVVEFGLVDSDLWVQVQKAALAIFARGQRLAADAGLILADTKYEFGLAADGRLMLIDEMHTPDSSRFWVAESYAERVANGDEPESLDKEPIRRWLLDSGYHGEGDAPTIPPEVVEVTTGRYIRAFETLTGTTFQPGTQPVDTRLQETIQ